MISCIDCIPCFVRQALDACRMITADEALIQSLLSRVLALLSARKLDVPPPVIVAEIHRLIRAELGKDDPYEALKKRSTEKALELSESATKMIAQSKDPFAAAVRFAIAGNILDFGAKTQWDEKRVLHSFYQALDKNIPQDKTDALRCRLEKANTVLVLGDNAGEAVFDRILIENFPGQPKVYYAVKGSAVINDVTAKDALDAGLGAITEILPNGTDIPGTWLESCSPEFRRVFDSADVVISKGQGNFESLGETNREVFFLLQIKCESLGKRNGYSVGDWVVASRGGQANTPTGKDAAV